MYSFWALCTTRTAVARGNRKGGSDLKHFHTGIAGKNPTILTVAVSSKRSYSGTKARRKPYPQQPQPYDPKYCRPGGGILAVAASCMT
jgi:hypothetical protein